MSLISYDELYRRVAELSEAEQSIARASHPDVVALRVEKIEGTKTRATVKPSGGQRDLAEAMRLSKSF